MNELQNHVQIEEQVSLLVKQIQESQLMADYIQALTCLEASEEAKKRTDSFLKAKKSFQEIEKYGAYAPGYEKIRNELYEAKKNMDSLSVYMDFKSAQHRLSELLDEIAVLVAQSVSTAVPVDLDVLMRPSIKKNCNCSSGSGGCHCSK